MMPINWDRVFTDRTLAVTTDSFENWALKHEPYGEWTLPGGVGGPADGMIIDDHAAAGSRSFANQTNVGDGVAFLESDAPDGEAPSQITYAYRETTNSGGHAYKVTNANGDDILRVGTNNPQATVEHAGGRTVVAGSTTVDPDYDAWRRFTITFDWANDQFDVLWEDLEGTTADQTETNLGFINAASGIHGVAAGEFPFSGTSMNTNGNEFCDQVYGVRDINREFPKTIADFNDQDLSAWQEDTDAFDFTTTASEVKEGTAALRHTGQQSNIIWTRSLPNVPNGRDGVYRIWIWGVNGVERPRVFFNATDTAPSIAGQLGNTYSILLDFVDDEISLQRYDGGSPTTINDNANIGLTTTGYQELHFDIREEAARDFDIRIWDDAGNLLTDLQADDDTYHGAWFGLWGNAPETPAEIRYDLARQVA